MLRGLARALAGLAALVGAYLGAAVLGALLPGPRADIPPGAEVEVLLLAGPIHYDLLLPADEATRAALQFAEAGGVPLAHPAVEWILVGWGAEQFYTTIGTYRDIDLSALWRGAIGDRSVLRVDVVGPLPEGLHAQRLALSGAQYAALLARITAERDPARPALDHPGLGATDAFFPARGRFHLLRTCNVWIGEALRAAGVPMGAWTPTPFAVRLSHWWHHA